MQRGDRTLSAGELRAYIGHLLRIGNETGPELADVALLLALYAGGQRMAQLLRAKAREAERAKQEGRAPERAGLWLFSTHGRVAMTPRP